MDIIKDYSISDIVALEERQAAEMAEEMINIKGFQVYLIDFSGYFGYSAVVFGNGRQIRYANDYALHHAGKTKEELKAFYVESMNNKLFTEDQLKENLQDYDEYRRKDYFIRNYYPMQFDYLSIFQIFHNDEEEKAFRENQKKNYPYLCRSACAFFQRREIGDKINDLIIALEYRQAELKNTLEYWVDAFKYEMYNHEYVINWQADYDTLSAFGGIRWHGDDSGSGKSEREKYFDELNFTDIQRNAYNQARREYLSSCGEY